ncbi:hypothetical protein EJ110_NYTH04427 [Nymphaea thermarum]|nr:hypothetical protein EJ110_NYTH04427 [Nymphaea thermarum]
MLTFFREDLRRKTIPEIAARTIKHVRERVEKSSSRASWLTKTRSPCGLMALEDFRHLFHRTLEELDATLEDLNNTKCGEFEGGRREHVVERRHDQPVHKIDRRKERRAVESGEAFPKYGGAKHGFPRWVSADDHRLLQANVSHAVADLVVAKDGNGHFTTISEAVAAAPNKSATRFVIYIKAGGYYENVEVPS